jgi:para-aminobenzoate synthetase component 1
LKKNILSRISKKFKSKDLKIFREKLLIWSNTFSTSTFLNSNNYNTDIGKYECICASEIFTSTPFTLKDSTLKLQNYIDKVNDWIFGYINYDLKNEIESLESNNCDNFNLPNLYFFQPKRIWIIYKNHIEAHYIDSKQIEIDWIEINKIKIQNRTLDHLVPNLNPSLSKKQYVDKIKTLKNHIYRGDIYEANFCFEWFSENVTIDPLYVYRNLNRISQSPMSVYFKNDNLYLMCSSPACPLIPPP